MMNRCADVHLLITAYLDNDKESINYLQYVGISIKKYVAKEFYSVEALNKYEFIIKKIIADHTINSLPQTITHLTFGWNFNQTIDQLPDNIIELNFNIYEEMEFKKPINKLPKKIRIIRIYSDYDNEYVEDEIIPKVIKDVLLKYPYVILNPRNE